MIGRYIANGKSFNTFEEMNRYVLTRPDLYKAPWITYEEFYELRTKLTIKEDSTNEND